MVSNNALATVLVALLQAVMSQAKKTTKFRIILKRLEKTLRNIEPVFYSSGRLSTVLDRPEKETKKFIYYVDHGKEVVLKCSTIKCWNVYKKFVHANRLIRLDNEIVRFFQVELRDNMSTSMKNLIGIYALGEKMDRVLSLVNKRAGGFSSSCKVPGLPDFIVGLDFHVQELKRVLLKDNNQVVTVSAPGGCGKTTLVKTLCHDNEIEGINF